MQSYTARAGRLARLFLFLALPALPQVITLGSSGGTVQATDACFSGGQLFNTLPITPPGTAGTIRYGAQFSCTIPIGTSIPWLVTFHFVEPCAPGGGCSLSTVTAPGQRLFSVTVNDTPCLSDLDIFARKGSLNWLQRSCLVWPSSENVLRINFTASERTAVVSSIDYNTVALPQMWQDKVAAIIDAQPTVDSNGIVIPFASPTPAQAAMSWIMEDQIPNGSNPWPYGDIAEFGCNTTPNCKPAKHGVLQSILGAALANQPVLGAAISGSGTCTLSDSPSALTCPGAHFLTEAPGRFNGLSGVVTCTNTACVENSGSAFVPGMVGNILITIMGAPFYPVSITDATHLTLGASVGSTPVTQAWNYNGTCLIVATNEIIGTGTGRYSDLVYSASDDTHLGFQTYSTNAAPGTGLSVYKCPVPTATFNPNWWNIGGLGGNNNWNYYDVVLAAYRGNIRTAAQGVCGPYCTQARQFADTWLQWALNAGGGGASPRVEAYAGVFLRALDGKPNYFPGLYKIISSQSMAADLDPTNTSPAHIHDWREIGYIQGFTALGAIADTTANGGSDARHSAYCALLALHTPGFLKTVADGGYLNPSGIWTEPIYGWNQGFPFLGPGNSPWRVNIAIRALQYTYEVLINTDPLVGCNNPVLASQLLPVIQGAADWVYNRGISHVAQGGNGYPYYDADYETNGLAATQFQSGSHGTLAFTLGSSTIVGTGTSFLTDFACNNTDYIAPADYGVTFNYQSIYKGVSCPDNNHMITSFPFGHYGEPVNAPSVATYSKVRASWSAALGQCASSASYCNESNCCGADSIPAGNGGAIRDTPGVQGWMSLYCQPQPSCRATYLARADELMARFLRGPGDGPYGTNPPVGPPGGPAYPGDPTPDGWVQSLDGGSCGSGCGDGPFNNLGKGYAQASGWNNASSVLAYRLMPGRQSGNPPRVMTPKALVPANVVH